MTTNILLLISVNLILGIAAGVIMHRSDFCVAGMFRDLFLFRQTFMLKMLLILVVSAMLLFEVSRQFGLLPYYPFPLLGTPSVANVIGGVIFGIGMVLAGGCVVGTLYKMGSGSLLSTTAFIGLIVGSGIYAEIHPWWKSFIKATILFQKEITLPQVLDLSPSVLLLPIAVAGAVLIFLWARQDKLVRQSSVEGYLQPWKAAVLLSLVGGFSYLLVGMPLGITTAYAKMAASVENIFIPAHVAGNAFYSGIPLNYLNNLFQVQLEGGAGPHLDGIAFVQISVIVGIIAGSFVSALLLKEFSLYYRVPGRQYLSAFAGGIILALGSRMTPGCNVWHLFGGLPILVIQSILFLAGIFAGAWSGSKILSRYVLSPS